MRAECKLRAPFVLSSFPRRLNSHGSTDCPGVRAASGTSETHSRPLVSNSTAVFLEGVSRVFHTFAEGSTWDRFGRCRLSGTSAAIGHDRSTHVADQVLPADFAGIGEERRCRA